MGFLDTVSNAMDVTRKIELKNPVEIEELFDMLQSAPSLQGFESPALKKGIMGKTISYPEVANIIVKITVKNGIVTVTKNRVDHQARVTVGGVASFKVGKKSASIDEGSAYFKAIADTIETALAGK